LCSSAAAQTSAQQDKLAQLRQQISQQQEQLDKQLAEVLTVEEQLEHAETAIAASAKNLKRTRKLLNENKAEEQRLQAEQRGLQDNKQRQQKLLSELIKGAYTAGEHDYLKLLFSQDNVGKFERVNAYYQYLNDARKEQIRHFTQLIDEIDKVELQLNQQRLQLSELQRIQSAEGRKITVQRAEREKSLTSLRSTIRSETQKIELLRANERELLKAIEDAQREQKQQQARQPVKQVLSELKGDLASLKGKLTPPGQGSIQWLFGKKRQGQVNWKGVLIEGKMGSSVTAIHEAVVLYADWLKGFGLVLVLDHGEGYMSLYGHNQALLKQVGDPVASGEVIALMGQSGGQSSPSLYFEIRHKAKAINPKGWIRN
jgi:septal ring factor EnvC (AmiA/AmiB activator)